ncbi:MAG: hypothetical protein ACO3YN_02695 [Rubrivivax sp.]
MAGIMRNTLTAVLVRGEWLQGDFDTEPYEAAWAAEALFFVRLMGVRGTASAGTLVECKVQLSPDGIRWVDEGTVLRVDAQPEALVYARVGHFGGWLRLVGHVPAGLEVQPVVTLSLKA